MKTFELMGKEIKSYNLRGKSDSTLKYLLKGERLNLGHLIGWLPRKGVTFSRFLLWHISPARLKRDFTYNWGPLSIFSLLKVHDTILEIKLSQETYSQRIVSILLFNLFIFPPKLISLWLFMRTSINVEATVKMLFHPAQ